MTDPSAAGRADALQRITGLGIVPVVRAASADTARRIAEALVAGGLDVIEITMTVPAAADVIAALTAAFGRDALIGAGTVTTPAQLEASVAAGARFVVTPCLVPDVIAGAAPGSVAIVGGALTPTEVLAARRAGADIVKVFPAGAAGGPAYIRALRGPFPDIPLMATGGVGLDAVQAYFDAGVAAIGAGGELISRSAVAAGRYDEISDSARAFRDAARRARAREAPVR